jgi:acyl-CoA thioesterase-2
VFEGTNQQLDYHRLFGGQILAQLIRAACVSCPDKILKSLHTVFAREGRADEPVRYEVTRHRQGRSFATLMITARQSRGVLATDSICMHIAESGPELQDTQPAPRVLGEEHRVELDLIPWETRSTDDLDATAVGPPTFQVWTRTPAVDADLAPALTAYATDLTLIGTALRPLDGFNQRGNGTVFISVVTSHTLWFPVPHRPVASVAPAQPAARARSLFWSWRRALRRRRAGRLLRTGGPAALPRVTAAGKRIRHSRADLYVRISHHKRPVRI